MKAIKNSFGNSQLGVRRNRHAPEPAWEVATLFPEQGEWSTEDYLALPGNHLVELSDGFLEFLPMPTPLHQWIVFYFCRLLDDFASRNRLGQVLPAPLPVQLWSGKFREPDVVFKLRKSRHRARAKFWEGADLVIEVVSDDPKARRRDLISKRGEYAKAGISEYWIVDQPRRQILVLCLQGEKYVVHGNFKPGQQARSRLLRGFEVDVTAAFTSPWEDDSDDENP
jgi:Uma2 family endonuclease